MSRNEKKKNIEMQSFFFLPYISSKYKTYNTINELFLVFSCRILVLSGLYSNRSWQLILLKYDYMHHIYTITL